MQPPVAQRPPQSLPHWPGSLAAPLHAARALLLLVEGAAGGDVRLSDTHASPVQVSAWHTCVGGGEWRGEQRVCGGV